MKIYPSVYLILATLAHVTVEDAGEWSNSEYKKDPEDFRLKNQEQLQPYERTYKSKFSESRRDNRKDKIEETQRSLYGKRHNGPPSVERNEYNSQESDWNGQLPKSRDDGLKKAWKRNIPIRKPARNPTRINKRLFAERKKKTNRKVPVRVFGIRQNKKSFVSRKVDAVELYRKLLMKSGQLKKFRTLGKVKQIELLRNLLRANRNPKREKPTEKSWKTTTQPTVRNQYSIEPSKTPLELRRDVQANKYNNANHYRLVGTHPRHAQKPQVVFTNIAAHKKNVDHKFQSKETRVDPSSRQESSLENIQKKHQKSTSPLATASLASRINRNNNAFMLSKNSDSVHYRIPVRKNVFPAMQYKNELSYNQQMKGNPGLIRKTETETKKKGADEDDSKEEKNKDDKGNDEVEQRQRASANDQETQEKIPYRNPIRRRKTNFRFPVKMKMEMRPDNRRPMLRNRKYGFTRPSSLFHNEARHFERRRKTQLPSTVIPLRVYRKEDKSRLFESTRNIPKRSDLRDNIVQQPEFVVTEYDNPKSVHSPRNGDQDSSEDLSDSQKNDKMPKYHSRPPLGMMDSYNMAGDFQYGHRPVTYTMPRPLYGRPDYYDQLPFVDVPGGKTRSQTSEENTSSENDQRDQQDYNDDNDTPSYTDMQGSDMTVGGDRTIDVHTFYDNNPMYTIPDQKPDDDDDASVENGHDDGDADQTNSRQDSGSEEQDTPKHFQQTIHKNHDSPDTLLIVLDNKAKAKKKSSDRSENLNYKQTPPEKKRLNPAIKADHSYSSGILVLLDNQKKSKQNNANIHPALELSSNGKQKKTLNPKPFYNYTTREKLKDRLTVDIQNGHRERGRGRINRPPKRNSDSFRNSYNNLQHQGRKSALDNLLIELGTKENIFNIRTSNNEVKPSYHARISASKSLQEDRRHDVRANNSSNITAMERVKEIVANERRLFNGNAVQEKKNHTASIPDGYLNIKPNSEHLRNHTKEVGSYYRRTNNDLIAGDHNGNKKADNIIELSESNSTFQKPEKNGRLRGITNKSFQGRIYHPRMHVISDNTAKDGKHNPNYHEWKQKQSSPVYQRGGVDYVYGPLHGIPHHAESLGDEGEKDDESEETPPDEISLYSDIDGPLSDKLTPIYPSQLHDIYDYSNINIHTGDKDDDDDDDDGDEKEDDDDNDINQAHTVNVEPLVVPDRLRKVESVDGTWDHNPHLTRGRGDKPKSVIKGLHSTHIPQSLIHPLNDVPEEKLKPKDQPMDNLNPYYPNVNHLKSFIDFPPDNMEDYHEKITDYVNDDGDDDTEEDNDDDDDDEINRHFIEHAYPTDVIDHHALSNAYSDFQTPFYGISHDHEDAHSSQEAIDTGDEEAANYHDLTLIHSRHNDNARDLYETVPGVNENATTNLPSLDERHNPTYISMRSLYNKHSTNRDYTLESFEDSPADSNSMGDEAAYVDKKYKFRHLDAHQRVLSDHGEHLKLLDNRGVYTRNAANKPPFSTGLYGIVRKKSLRSGRKEKVSDEEYARSIEDAPSDQDFYATSLGKKKPILGSQYADRKDHLKFFRGHYRFHPHFGRLYHIMNNGKNSLTHNKLYKRLKQIHETKSRPRISNFGHSQNGSKSHVPPKDRQQNINNDSGNFTFFYRVQYPHKGNHDYAILPRLRTIDSEESPSDRSSNEHGPSLEDGSDDLRDDTVVTSGGIYYKGRGQHGENGGTFESRHHVKRMNETKYEPFNGTSELSNGNGDKQGLRVNIGTRVSLNESVNLEVLGGELNASQHMGSDKEGSDVPLKSENKGEQSSQYDSDSISLERHGSEQAEFHDYFGKSQEKTEGLEDLQGTPESKLPNIEDGSIYHDIYGTPESDVQKEVRYDNYPDSIYSDYDYIGGTAVSQLFQGESMLHGASGALPDGVLTRQETIYSENQYPHSQQHNFMKDNGDGRFKYGGGIVDMNGGTEKKRFGVESQREIYLSHDNAGKIEPNPNRYPDGRHEDIQKLALDKKLSHDKFHESTTKKGVGAQPGVVDSLGRERKEMVINYEPRYISSGNGAYFDERHLNGNLFESLPDDTTSDSIQISPSATVSTHLEITSPTDKKENLNPQKLERLPDVTDTKRSLIRNKDFKLPVIPEGGIVQSSNGLDKPEGKTGVVSLETPSKFSDSVKDGYESVLSADTNVTLRSSVLDVNQSSDKMKNSDFRSSSIGKENGHSLDSLIIKDGDETMISASDLTRSHHTAKKGVQNQIISSNGTEPDSNPNIAKLSPDKDEKDVDSLRANVSKMDHHSNLRGKVTRRQKKKTFSQRFRTEITNWGRSGHSIMRKVKETFEKDVPKTSRGRIEDDKISTTRKPELVDSKQDQKAEPGIQFEERNTSADNIFPNILPDILHKSKSDFSRGQIIGTTTKSPELIDAGGQRRSTKRIANPTPSLTKPAFLSGPEINPITFPDRSPPFETRKDLISDLTHQEAHEPVDVYPGSLNNEPAISLSSIDNTESKTNENTLPGDSVGVNISDLESSLYSNKYGVLDEISNVNAVKLPHIEEVSLPSFQPPPFTSDRMSNADHFSEGHLKPETHPLFNLFDKSLQDDNQSMISGLIPFRNADMVDLSPSKTSSINIDDNASFSGLNLFDHHSTLESSQSQTGGDNNDNNSNNKKTLIGNKRFTDERTVSGLPLDNRETNWYTSLGNERSHVVEPGSWYTQPEATNVDYTNGKVDKDGLLRLAQTNQPGLSGVSHLNINNLSQITKGYRPTNSGIMPGVSDFSELGGGSLPGVSINENPTDIFNKEFTSKGEFSVGFPNPDLLENHGITDKDVMHSFPSGKELSSSHSLLEAFPKMDKINVDRIGDIYPSELPPDLLSVDDKYSRQLNGGPSGTPTDSHPTPALSLTEKHTNVHTDSGNSKVDLQSFMGISPGDIPLDFLPISSATKTSPLTHTENNPAITNSNAPIITENLSKVLHSNTANMDTLAEISHSIAMANQDLLIRQSHRSDPYITDPSQRTVLGPTDSLTETVHKSDPLSINTPESGISFSNPASIDPMTGLLDVSDPTRIDGYGDIPFSTNPRDANSMIGTLNNNDPTRISYHDPVDTSLSMISHSKNPIDVDIGTGISHIDYSTDPDVLSRNWENKDQTLPHTLHSVSHNINTSGADRLGTTFQVNDRLDTGQLSEALFTNGQTEMGVSHIIDTEATRNQRDPGVSDTLTGQSYSATEIDPQSTSLISVGNDKAGIDMLPTLSYIDNLTGIHEITPNDEHIQTLTDLLNTEYIDNGLIINKSQADSHRLEKINTNNPDVMSIPTGSQYNIPTDTTWDINETALLHSLPEISNRNTPSDIDNLILTSDPKNMPTLPEVFSDWGLPQLHNDTVHSTDTKRIHTVRDSGDPMSTFSDGIRSTDLPGAKDMFLTEGLTNVHTDEYHNLSPSSMNGLSQDTKLSDPDPSRKEHVSADPATMDNIDHISDISQLQTDFLHGKDPLALEGMTHLSRLVHPGAYSDSGNDPTGIDGLTHIQDPTNLSHIKVNHTDMTEKTLSPETSHSSGPSDLLDTFVGPSHSSDPLLSPGDPSHIDGLTGIPDLFTLPRISHSHPFLDLTDKSVFTLTANESQDRPYRQTGKVASSKLSPGNEFRQQQTLFGTSNIDAQTNIHTVHQTPPVADQADMFSLPETSYIGDQSDGKILRSASSQAGNKGSLSTELSFIDGLTGAETMPKLSLSDLQTDGLPQLSHAEGIALSKMLDTVGLTGDLALSGVSETKTLTDPPSVTHSQSGFGLSPTQGKNTGLDKVDRFVAGISSRKPIHTDFPRTFQSSWHDLFLNHSRGFNFDAPLDTEQIHQTSKRNESSFVDVTSEVPLTDGVDSVPSGSSHFVLGDNKFSLNNFLGNTRISDPPKTSEPDPRDPLTPAAGSFSSSVDSNQGSQDFRTLLDLPSTFLFGQLMNDSIESANLDFAQKSNAVMLTEDLVNGESRGSTTETKNLTNNRIKDSWTSPQNLTLPPRAMKTTRTVSDMSAPFDLGSFFRVSGQTRTLRPEIAGSTLTASDKRPIFLTIQSMKSSDPSLDFDPDLIPVVQHGSTTRVPASYDVSADIKPTVQSDLSQTSTRTKQNISSTHTFPITKENTAGQFSLDDHFVTDGISLPEVLNDASKNIMTSGSSFSDSLFTLLSEDSAARTANKFVHETSESHSQNDATGFTKPFGIRTQFGSQIVKSDTESGILSQQNSSDLISFQSEDQYFHTGQPLSESNDTSQIPKQTNPIPVTNFPTMIEDFDKTYLLRFHIPEDHSVTREIEESFSSFSTTDRPTEKTFWWMSGTSNSPETKSSLVSFTLPQSTFIHSVAPHICTDCINHIWEDRQSLMLGMHSVLDFKNATFQRDPHASYYLVGSTYEVIRSLNLNLDQRQICQCIFSGEPIQKIQVECKQQMHGRLIHVEVPNKRRDREMQCRISIYNGTWQGFKSCKEGQKYCDYMFGTRFGECTYALGRNELLKYYSMCNTVLCREAGDMKQWKKDACDVIDALAHECELAGVKVAWREVTKCHKQCPENMEFKTNVSVCRRTCSNFDAGASCTTNQTESRCDCQDGFVLSQETCIPSQECGCTYQGHYINIGETLSLPGCKKLVTCTADGKGWSQMKLIEIPGCSARQSCQMVNGSYGCIVQCGGEVCHENATCEEDKCRCNAGLYGDGITTCLSTNDTCTCLVSGLSRYRTYDGQLLDYVATCPMELTRTLDKSNPSSLVVYGTTLYNSEQMMMFGTRRYRTVNITMNSLKIYMDTIGDIYVDEIKTTLPFRNFKHNVSAASSDGWTTVCSGDGVYVSYDRKHRVKIFLPKTYREKLTGMCGNCNGESEDDFHEKHAEKASSVDLVGASYMLNSAFSCGQVTSINKCPEGVEKCEIMRSGPFAGCHPYLDPGLAEAYYESCMQMTCAFKAHKDYLKKLTCAALESLDTECMNRGYIVEWRSQSLCSISCCRPMVYNRYINASDANCVSTPPLCPAQPVDGCVCGEGYVLDNNKCVLPQDCGCWYNSSTYIQLGETYHIPGCHLMIQCRKVATGKKKLVVTHLENGCGKNSKCILKEHKHQCVCEKGFARNKNDTLCEKIPECGDHPVDVVFVVDTSGSINMTGLNSTKHFLSHFINSTNIGPNNMQISILLFNDKPHNLFQLNKYAEKQQMLTALQKIGPPEGTTYLGRALVFVALVSLQEKMGARENVNRAVIILTDGILHDAQRAERWSALLRRQKQAELFTIGVGEADPAQLQRLTRDKNNVFYVREYEKLNSIMDNLLQGVCK